LHDPNQLRVHCVSAVSSIKPVITVRPVGEQPNRAELAQFILNGVKSKPAQVFQFAHMMLPQRHGKEQSQQFGSHLWK